MRSGGKLALAFLAYTAIAVLWLWPLVRHISTALPHDLGDPVLSTYILWWNAHHLPFSASWWDGRAFYPVKGTLAFSDHRAGLALIASPIQWMSGGPVLAHNLVLLLSFPLCAIGAHALAVAVTGSDVAGLIAGLAFGFSPYRAAHIEHLELLCPWGVPLALAALHTYLDDRRTRWLAFAAAALVLQGLSSSYYFVFAAPLLALWILWFARPGRPVFDRSSLLRAPALAVVIAVTASFAVMLPIFIDYRRVLSQLNLVRTMREITIFSADITGVVDGSALLAVWHSMPDLSRPEGHLFPGATVLGLILASSVGLGSPPAPSAKPVRHVMYWLHRALLVLTVVFTSFAVSALLRPWTVRMAGVTVSVTNGSKPATLALLFLLIWALTTRRFLDAFHRRSVFAFYLTAAIAMWLLALGPAPAFLGHVVLYRGPYAYLMRLPGFASLRAPGRFAMLMMLALAVAAAAGFERLTRAVSRNVRLAFAGLLMMAILADGWMRGLAILPPPGDWRWPEQIASAAALLELPMGTNDRDIAAVYRSIRHGKPVINGYSGFEPAHYQALRLGLERRDASVFTALAEHGPVVIGVDLGSEEGRALDTWLDGLTAPALPSPAVFRLTADPDDWRSHAFYYLPRGNGHRARPHGTRLAVVRGTANVGTFDLDRVNTSDPMNRWLSPEHQQGNEQVTFELDGAHHIGGVAIGFGPDVSEFPRMLRVDTSLDGSQWISRWSGPVAGLAIGAALDSPREPELWIELAEASPARFVRLNQIGNDPLYRWSLRSISIRSGPADNQLSQRAPAPILDGH